MQTLRISQYDSQFVWKLQKQATPLRSYGAPTESLLTLKFVNILAKSLWLYRELIISDSLLVQLVRINYIRSLNY
jgi:hypothetical protein